MKPFDEPELMKRYGIGLTGGIACGKTTVANILRNKGFPIIDADALARKAVETGSKGLAEIVSTFGGQYLNEDGSLNRAMLADYIFENSEARKKLEQITHPIIHEILHKKLEELGLFENPRYWFYEATLLFETGRARLFREVWCVYCPKEVQLARIQKRDNKNRKLAEKILESQMSSKDKAALAEVVIDTTSPIEELEAKIKIALERLRKNTGSFVKISEH